MIKFDLNSKLFWKKIAIQFAQLNLCPVGHQSIFWQKHLPMSDFHLPVVIQFVKKIIYLTIGLFFFLLMRINADLLICSNTIWNSNFKYLILKCIINNILYSEIGFVPA